MKTRKSVTSKDSTCPSQKDIRFLESQLIKEVQTDVFVSLEVIGRNVKRETRKVKPNNSLEASSAGSNQKQGPT